MFPVNMLLFNTALEQKIYYLPSVCRYSWLFIKILFCTESVFMFFLKWKLFTVLCITQYIVGKFIWTSFDWLLFLGLSDNCRALDSAQKMKFYIKDFSSKCDQIHRFLRIWSHLLEKSVKESFIFCVMSVLKSCLYNKIIKTHCLQNDQISCDLIKWLWEFLFLITQFSWGEIALDLCYLQYRKSLLLRVPSKHFAKLFIRSN